MSKKLVFWVSFVLVFSFVLTNGARAELVGWWRLDEGSGTTAIDSSGSGNDGTFTGDPQWVAGKVGGALSFDGGDYVNVPGVTDIKPESLTLMTWVLFDTVEGGRQDYVSKDDDYAFSLHEGAADQKIHGIVTSAGGWPVVHGNTVVETDTWYHTALTYDSGTKMLLLYLDGELDAELSAPDGLEHRRGGPLTIGTFSGRDLFGKLDDVKIFDEALSLGQIKGEMVGGGFPYAYAPTPKDGVYHIDTWVNIAWRAGDFAVSHDVYFGDNFDDVGTGAESAFIGNQAGTFLVAGFPGFAYPDGLIPGTTYYWRIDEVNDAEPNSPWKGDIWSFSIPPRTAYLPDPADGAESVGVDGSLSWTGGFGAKLHTVYFGDNFDEVDNAAGGLPQGTTDYSPGALKMAKTYYWRVDEFDVLETHKGNIWSFTTEGAVAALNPANGAVDVTQTPILTWTPGFGASHEVYFGADAASLELKGSGNLGSESLDSGQLEWDTTYYWRVDEANSANADSPWTGPLWSFTTANFLIIDDFEGYNDLDPADPASNRIFNAWLDGFDNSAANGSVVGNANPPFAEQTIVNSGNQSMPFAYDNAVGKSEATLTLTSNNDWTVKGVNRLTIWYRGGSANAAEQLYVVLNGTAVVTNDNPDAAQTSEWTEWNIDLQAFGVNLANVTSITLGLGNRSNPTAGGSGMMYFDDIRLYQPAP
ncbi:MAG: LamG domain-containing protein [Planctomycetes bacterium]|nr:LamG domain-containing protein [Planctomycetota bacterium]